MTLHVTTKKRRRATRQCAATIGARASVSKIEAVLAQKKGKP